MLSLLTLLLAPPAQATEVAPGRASVLAPCSPDPDAACWSSAARLSRFAPAPGVDAPAVEIDLRLAHSEGQLLARVAELPQGASLELVVASGPSRSVHRDSVLRLSDGLSSVSLSPPATRGQLRALQATLLLPEGDGERAFYWSPTGPGAPTEPSLTLIADAPGRPLAIQIEEPADGGLRITAAGAALDISAERTRIPKQSRSHVGPPWSASGPSPLEATPIGEGWHTITATWSDADGVTTDLQVGRVYLRGAPAPEGEALGIHPAPLRSEQTGGRAFVPSAGAAIRVTDEALRPAAELLADELERLAGVRLEIASGPPKKGDVVFGPVADSGFPKKQEIPPEMLEIAGSPEGFLLSASSRGAYVGADGLRGAVYGALALADAVGVDGEAPALVAADRPVLEMRALFHTWSRHGSDEEELNLYIDFLRRVVARGRYNTLILGLKNGYQFQSRPEIANNEALSREQVERILDAARGLGLEVIPATNSPGHSEWMVGPHPELQEGTSRRHMCSRNPETYELVGDLYDELLELFDHPRFIHIGHDEIFWRSHQRFEEERCPRCAGTPRGVLLAEDLKWNLEFLGERGVTPLIWSDMLLEDWHGRIDGAHEALDHLTPEQLQAMTVVTWSPLGEPLENLGAARDMPIVRGHTVYVDWKRDGLAEQAPALLGECMVLTFPNPWTLFSGALASRPLGYSWHHVLLAGTTAWRPTLSETPIATTLLGLEGLTATTPGYARPPAWSGESRPLPVEGPLEATPPILIPQRADVAGVPFEDPTGAGLQLRAATEGAPVRLQVGGLAAGAAILQASRLSPDLERQLYAARRSAPSSLGLPFAQLRIHYRDGEESTVPLYYGYQTFAPDGDQRARLLWGSSGVAPAPTPAAATSDPAARDGRLYRLDWLNPRPEVEVDWIAVEVTRAGGTVWVAGASALEPR